MKRLLIVAGERALTRFIGEALVGQSLEDLVGKKDASWDLYRAHTALEAEVLVTKGRRRFHAIIIDHDLPDQSALELTRRLRRSELAEDSSIFLVLERGRDVHTRRTATDKYGVSGFIQRPITPEALRWTLKLLERRRRVLLVDSDAERGERFAQRLQNRDFEVELRASHGSAVQVLPSFAPDAVAVALVLEDGEGVSVCADIKRTSPERFIPVLLYGQLNDLAAQEDGENSVRADDFIQAPFDDGVLIDRVEAQIGKGALRDLSGVESGDDSMPESHDLPTGPGRVPKSSSTAAMTAPPAAAASVPTSSPGQRLTRRVPCYTSLRVRDGDQVMESQTLDISHGGIFFEMEPPLAEGTVVELAFQLPDQDRVIEAVGRVAWTHPSGVGVKFSRIDKTDLHAIVGYVNRVARLLYSPVANS